jgi:Caspase domain
MIRIFFTLLFVIVPWTSKAMAQDVADRFLIRHGHALLIGVSSYDDRSWPPLENVPDEIKQLKAGLAYHFQSVETLIDPDTSEIRSSLNKYIAQYGQVGSERIFLYYAGHGFTDRESRFMGYITGKDTPAYTRDRTGAILNSISMLQFDNIFTGGSFR